MAKNSGVVLREIKNSDVEGLTWALQDKRISKYMTAMPYPYTIDDAQEWIKTVKKSEGKIVNYVVDVDGRFAGIIALRDVVANHKGMLGYWLVPELWGYGIMSAGVEMVLDVAFKQMKLKRIYADVFTENKASIKLLEKLGFKKEALMKKYYFKNKKYYDAYLYAKVKG